MENTTVLTTGSRRSTRRRGLRPGAALVGGMVLAGAGLAIPPADPASAANGGWKPTRGALTVNRSDHTATPLADGKVLMVGGAGPEDSATAELYDPATSTFSPTTPPSFPRDRHTATLLADDRVLVVGGADYAAAATAEIYDPATKAWLPVPPSGTARWNHTATLLADGRVLVAGGTQLGVYDPLTPSGSERYAKPIGSAQVYDPAAAPAEAWAHTGDMVAAVHSMPAVALPGGKVLVAGGSTNTVCLSGSGQSRHCGTTSTAVAQVFDPAATDAVTGRAGAWKATTTPMTEARSLLSATVLADGKVLVADNADFELYDPATDAWGGRGPLQANHVNPDAAPSTTRLADGKVLLVGGLATPEVYDPLSSTWAKTDELAYTRRAHSATRLGDGTVLVAGGRESPSPRVGGGSAGGSQEYALLATEEIYDPALLESTPGFLRVLTDPAVPSQISVRDFAAPTVTQSGQIQTLPATPRDHWGIWVKLPPRVDLTKPYDVCFSEVAGFITPPCQPANVHPGATTTVTGTFVPAGYLRVMTDPPLASTISVDGIARNDWAVWSYFPAGAHQVCFGPVEGWAPPPCQAVTLAPGGNAEVTGTFTPDDAVPDDAAPPAATGMLRVATSPAVPSQISIDGIARDSYGLNWLKLPPGTYRVSFSAPPGYKAAQTTLVTVKADETVTVDGVFRPLGFLRAITRHSVTGEGVAGTVSVDGAPRNDWGMWTSLEPGPKRVCFGLVQGFVTPPCQDVTLTTAGMTVTGSYVPLPPG